MTLLAQPATLRARAAAPAAPATTGTIACTFDIECDDGNPCTLDSCDLALGAPVGTGTCINGGVANGESGNCDDDVFCNGAEVCQGGACATTDIPDCPSAGQVCDEFRGGCADPCTSDAECDDLELCNGSETCGADGVCQPGENPCGPGAYCLSYGCVGGSLRHWPCDTDEDCPGSQCVDRLFCFFGRCCDALEDGTFACSKQRAPSVESTPTCDPGMWFAGDTGLVIPQAACPSCPLYSSVIVATTDEPQGPHLVEVGPVSDSQTVNELTGTPLNRIGDDYVLHGDTGFIWLEEFRFVGEMIEPGRVVVEFSDANGLYLGEHTFEPETQAGTGVPAVRYIWPPLVIPSRGFVTMRIARREAGVAVDRRRGGWRERPRCPLAQRRTYE